MNVAGEQTPAAGADAVGLGPDPDKYDEYVADNYNTADTELTLDTDTAGVMGAMGVMGDAGAAAPATGDGYRGGGDAALMVEEAQVVYGDSPAALGRLPCEALVMELSPEEIQASALQLEMNTRRDEEARRVVRQEELRLMKMELENELVPEMFVLQSRRVLVRQKYGLLCSVANKL